MAIIVVGGSGKDVGKTALMCAVISALREMDWTAVKITGHDYSASDGAGEIAGAVIWEDEHASEATDTGRYLLAGAKRALLVTRVGDEAPVAEIRRAIAADRNVIFESNRIVDVVTPDVCLALVGGEERKSSFDRLLRVADAVVMRRGTDGRGLPKGIRFELDGADQLPEEMVGWMRERLIRERTV